MTVTVKLFLAPDVWTEKPDVGIHDPTSFVVHGVRGAPSGYRVLSYINREIPNLLSMLELHLESRRRLQPETEETIGSQKRLSGCFDTGRV